MQYFNVMDCGLLLIPQKQRMFAFIINHLQSGKAICFLNDSDVQGCVHAHYCVEKCALLFHSLSQKPLMVIHHKDECPYSQGTALTLLCRGKNKTLHAWIHTVSEPIVSFKPAFRRGSSWDIQHGSRKCLEADTEGKTQILVQSYS